MNSIYDTKVFPIKLYDIPSNVENVAMNVLNSIEDIYSDYLTPATDSDGAVIDNVQPLTPIEFIDKNGTLNDLYSLIQDRVQTKYLIADNTSDPKRKFLNVIESVYIDLEDESISILNKNLAKRYIEDNILYYSKHEIQPVQIPNDKIVYEKYKGSRSNRSKESEEPHIIHVTLPQENDKLLSHLTPESSVHIILGILWHYKFLLNPSNGTIVDYIIEESERNNEGKTKVMSKATLQNFIKVNRRNPYIVKSSEAKRQTVKITLQKFLAMLNMRFKTTPSQNPIDFDPEGEVTREMINFINQYFVEHFEIYLKSFNLSDIQFLFKQSKSPDTNRTQLEASLLSHSLHQIIQEQFR